MDNIKNIAYINKIFGFFSKKSKKIEIFLKKIGKNQNTYVKKTIKNEKRCKLFMEMTQK
jgi:hypothetical protein